MPFATPTPNKQLSSKGSGFESQAKALSSSPELGRFFLPVFSTSTQPRTDNALQGEPTAELRKGCPDMVDRHGPAPAFDRTTTKGSERVARTSIMRRCSRGPEDEVQQTHPIRPLGSGDSVVVWRGKILEIQEAFIIFGERARLKQAHLSGEEYNT